MNWELIHKLLDKLDQAVNSNSFFIELGIPEGDLDLEKILIQHLKAGNFHFELVKQDINRDWNNYSEIIFPKNYEQPILITRPGNTWNGNENLQIEKKSKEFVAERLIDILAGQEKFYSKSSLGTPLKLKEAKELTRDLLKMIDKSDEQWKAYNIKPDFLYQLDDYYNSGYIQLGYFENCGRDMVFAFLVDGQLYILLTNGYS